MRKPAIPTAPGGGKRRPERHVGNLQYRRSSKMSTHTGEPSKISRSSCRWNNGNGSFNASAHKKWTSGCCPGPVPLFFFGFPEGLHIHLDDLRVLIGFEIIDLLPQIDHGCVLGIIEGPIRCLYHAVGQGNPLQNVKASNDSLLYPLWRYHVQLLKNSPHKSGGRCIPAWQGACSASLSKWLHLQPFQSTCSVCSGATPR